MTTESIETLRTLINSLGFSEEEKDALRTYFSGNEKRQNDARAFISDYKTDEAKLRFLRSLILTSADRPPKKRRVEAEAHFVNTWKTAIAYKVMDIPGAGGFIKQPECKPLAIVDQPVLFIRQSYVDLYNLVVDNAEQRRRLRALITGASGMGKSCFLIYFLIRLVKECNARVVFETRQGFVYYFDGQSEEYEVAKDRRDFANQLGFDDIWYLTDGVTDPLQGSAKTVVSLSPKGVRSQQFQEFIKPGCQEFYMPPWSSDELSTCRNEVFPLLPESLVQELYGKVGGVPRYVLEVPASEFPRQGASETWEKKAKGAAIKRVNEALKELNNIGSLLQCVKEDANYISISSRIFHHLSHPPDYEDGGIRWASPYIQLKVLERWEWQQWNALLQSYCDPMIPRGFKGFMFESYVIRLFMNGGYTLPCKKLGDVMNTNSNKKDKSSTKQQSLNEGELKLPSKPRYETIRRPEDLSKYTDSDILLIPTIKNFGAVDFLMTPDYLFQVTIAGTHPIKHKQLCNIVNSMQVNHRHLQDKKIRFYFVVPEDVYDNFQYQKIVTSDNKEVTKLSNNLENVEQWVVKISMTPETANRGT